MKEEKLLKVTIKKDDLIILFERNYEIRKQKTDKDSLILLLISEGNPDIKYRLSTDDRYPDIALIDNFIQNQITLSAEEEKFHIREDPQRHYIYINGNTEPLTAVRLDRIII